MARKKVKKVPVTVSRLKSFLSFSDNFGSGFASGWKTVRGTWTTSGGTATTSSTDYPIRTVQMTNENVSITLQDPGVGTGAALWVSDSGTWWSVVSKQETCSGCGSCSSYNPYNPCGAGGNCVASPGYSNNPTTYNYYVPSNCSGCNVACPGCGYSSTPYYVCSMTYTNGACKYGYTAYFTYYYTTYSYNSCCNGSPGYPASYTTPGSYVPGNPCAYTNPCVGTGGSCASNYNTYPRYLKIYKYASNTLSEMASITLDSVTSFAPIRALKVLISNSNKAAGTATITAKAFSDTSAVTQIGSDLVYNATGVTIVTNQGIIASDSAYNQTLSVENIVIQ